MEDYYKHLAEKYLNNSANEEEKEEVLFWFASEQGQVYLSSKIDADFEMLAQENSQAVYPDIDSGKVFRQIQKIKESAAILELSTHKKAKHRRFYDTFWNWRGMAAAVAGLTLMVFAAWLVYNQYNTLVHQTAFGETSTVTLPDQSTVVLNGNTIIKYSRNWHKNQPREVYLEGEAFFQVVHTASNQLFRVNTSDHLNVEVLGTAFNVSNRQRKTKVSLNSGKVRLSMKKKDEFLIMHPGELVEFDDASTQYVKKTVNPEVYSSWKSKKLIFENTSLSEIIHLLEETYGLTVEVSDKSLLTQKLNGTVPNDNVDILLEGISQLFDVHISRKDSHVRIAAYP